MKTRLKVTVLIFLVMVQFTEELKWNTKMQTAACCKGNKQPLIWNFTEGENERVTELHWFFNEKTLVCLASNSTGFLAAVLYEGRVERNGTAGIILKNVSLNDAGEYTLYVKLDVEKERNIQGINLTVVEPPPNQCKPIIKKEHPKGIISCSTSCERSPLSLEWIINGTKVPGDIGPYFVVNSSGTSEQPICCLRDFKCLDDYQTKFCTQNNHSFTEDMHTVADTNKDFTVILISLIGILMLIVVITCVITLKRRMCWLLHKCHYKTTKDIEGDQCERSLSGETVPLFSKDQQPHVDVNDVQVPEKTVLMFSKDEEPHSDVNDVQVPEETVLMIPNHQDPHADVQEPEKPSPILETLQELDADVKLDQIQEKPSPILGSVQDLDADVKLDQIEVAVKPKHSNTFVQCNEDLQQVATAAATADWSLQYSNQRVEIVISIRDTDIFKSVIRSNRALKAELQASRKETRKLKRQPYRKTDLRKKENGHKNSFGMTGKSSDSKNPRKRKPTTRLQSPI